MENKNSFLPESYKLPITQGNYTKLQDGENNIRILSSAIIGYEYWNTDNKPVRSKEYPKETPNIRLDKDGNPTRIKHFWAFVIWNYETKALQVMEVTQKTIMEGIKALVDNAKWGDPKTYDITITKSGEGLDTSYNVVPNPKEELDENVKMAHSDIEIDLEALYTGGDPFVKSGSISAESEEVIQEEDSPFGNF